LIRGHSLKEEHGVDPSKKSGLNIQGPQRKAPGSKSGDALEVILKNEEAPSTICFNVVFSLFYIVQYFVKNLTII